MKQIKIQPKSRKQIEDEIDGILAGKDRSQRGTMLRNAANALRVMNTAEEIRQMFIQEYIKKYGELESGKKTIEQIKQEALKDSQKAKEGLKNGNP
jgi:hypothetical protein